jgi:regulator of cell morphogenesis and NO signaling
MFLHTEIGELIERDPGLGFALYKCGIFFSEHQNDSISMVCRSQNIKEDWVVRALDSVLVHDPIKQDFQKNPHIPELIEHLLRVHVFFSKEKLPFLFKLIKNSDPDGFHDPQVGKDLKLLFPLFYEDFVAHIRKEETTTFAYTRTLYSVWNHRKNPAILQFTKPNIDLRRLALEHLEDDDEMIGIREMTKDYYCPKNAGTQQKVIFWELKKFEKDLRRHSKIENELFFPQVVKLEKCCREYLRNTFPDN